MFQRLLKVQVFLLLGILCSVSQVEVLAQSLPVTQIRSFPISWIDTDIRDIPLYGSSIVIENYQAERLEVYDLDGNERFSLDFAEGLVRRSLPRFDFEFIAEADLQNPNIAEVMVTIVDSANNINIRRINENGVLLFSDIVSSNINPSRYSYLYKDPDSQHGFAAIEISPNGVDSVLVYPFSDPLSSKRIAGELFYSGPYPSPLLPPLLIVRGDSLLIGYDAEFQEVDRIEFLQGAEYQNLLFTDFGLDGALDAYSTFDTIINGEEATRAIWYDSNGIVYLDTFASGRTRLYARYIAGFLPSDGQRYHTASFYQDINTSPLEISFRSDKGELVNTSPFGISFPSSVCVNGEEYLSYIIPNESVQNSTLFDSHTGEAELVIPAMITHEGIQAQLYNVIGQCEPNLPEQVALVYDQPSQQRILFTNGEGFVQAELPYRSEFGFAIRIDGNIYALSDLDEDGNYANTFYRINEQVSTTQSIEKPLGFTISPNPTRDLFQVDVDDSFAAEGTLDMLIYNLSGQAVASYRGIEKGQLLASPAAPGVYLVHLVHSATGRRLADKLVVR